MSETKTPWTPGPWRARGRAIDAQGCVDTLAGAVWGRIATAEDIDLDDAEGRHWTSGGSPEANARLIAAAPEMANLLERWCLLSNALYVDTEMVSATEAETRTLLANLKGD